MNCLDSPTQVLADAIGAAIHRDLDPVIYADRDWDAYHRGDKEATIEKSRAPRVDELHIDLFPQAWPSTALGYGGVGGQSITWAYTVIIEHRGTALVYFGAGGRLAYRLDARDPRLAARAQRCMPSARDIEAQDAQHAQ